MVKLSSIGYPKVYFRAEIGKVLYGDGSYTWTTSSDFYVKESIKNVKKRLKKYGLEYNKKLYDIRYSPKNLFSSVDYSLLLETYM